jgi:2-polyprenyl-6-methoxyphenol hydroxylase-like FAD-dependent oxidoreductase
MLDKEARVTTFDVKSIEKTKCCVVGGGPAGVVLSYMLARNGVPVILLESHHDFERDFRGDTLHPSTMEVMDELGLADGLLKLPHSKLGQMRSPSLTGQVTLADLSRLKTKFPYVTMMPQAQFLDFVTTRAKAFPAFKLIMGARVEELIEEDGQVRGVRYRSEEGWHEVRALLIVGADGRFSRLRKLAGFEPVKSSPLMDVLWFRLSRKAEDYHGLMARFGRGHLLIQLERVDQWQIAYVIAKGNFQEVKAAGLEALRRSVVETAPELADRIDELADWQQIAVLSVEANRLTRWYKPGLLLIGDAAHVMSPAGGNGINYAVMDAVAAANILSGPLKTATLSVKDLARVQKRRELPTRIIQGLVNLIQDTMVKTALDPQATFAFPAFLKLPVLRDIPARLMGFGILPEHVKDPTTSRAAYSKFLKGAAALVAGMGVFLLIRYLKRGNFQKSA